MNATNLVRKAEKQNHNTGPRYRYGFTDVASAIIRAINDSVDFGTVHCVVWCDCAESDGQFRYHVHNKSTVTTWNSHPGRLLLYTIGNLADDFRVISHMSDSGGKNISQGFPLD